MIASDLNLKGKDLLTLADYSKETILELINKAKTMKEAHLKGDIITPLKGKTLGMIFEKSSTRTRVSFEAGMLQLGGHALYLNSRDLQIGRGETISDTAKVLSQYVDAIMIRTFSHNIVEELAEHATIPIINGLTDLYHPCQALADLLTLLEVKGTLQGLKLAYIGDGNNVAHSLLIACSKVGIDISIATPKNYEVDAKVAELASAFAKASGSKIILTNNPVEAVQQADAIYSDVWTSMGQEEENEQRLKDFQGFQINTELVKHAKADYIFLHCLPAHREEEVTTEIIDGGHSYVFQQAGNRLHAQKALLVEILK
ncbi:ornithine carbamoyltransferase [Cytobacillus oceanisediminis]|uniref:Ornithine carbamoyltransferase n=2 Tax=Bacillales TaxID=1385 RepID=A0A7Y0PL93_9BACI|nr:MULTISPECIES: ornithine carbamoyltransferase [Bacillaceae]MBQ6446392.1 ornithine carbamoyltransferase [Bacillus sp. (in: firmicutes)]MBZ9533119.1 ornithine carbamoyltransferase [Cytobacillus oceanisediminis]MED3792170.1 ornithine carbamoyltransferase [Niallia alba]NMO76757.1 ornithine carbamoyltransferase [Niallia alba]UTI44594.1 ornithine carbamoyltransferase [Niallia sp. RD1]